MSLLEAIKVFKAAGGRVTLPRRTGEMVFAHPRLMHVVRINGRNKDVPMALRVYLKKLGLWTEGGNRCA